MSYSAAADSTLKCLLSIRCVDDVWTCGGGPKPHECPKWLGRLVFCVFPVAHICTHVVSYCHSHYLLSYTSIVHECGLSHHKCVLHKFARDCVCALKYGVSHTLSLKWHHTIHQRINVHWLIDIITDPDDRLIECIRFEIYDLFCGFHSAWPFHDGITCPCCCYRLLSFGGVIVIYFDRQHFSSQRIT